MSFALLHVRCSRMIPDENQRLIKTRHSIKLRTAFRKIKTRNYLCVRIVSQIAWPPCLPPHALAAIKNLACPKVLLDLRHGAFAGEHWR